MAVVAVVATGPAVAQDYDAGKTPQQMFATDCTACHNKPGGLAKGRDKSSLASFLREHYTTKKESADSLAAYLLGAGPGDTRQADVPGGPKSKRKAEREGEPKAEDEGENREDKRARAGDREPPKGPGEAILSKLRYYGSARGEAKDTARLASPERRLESYANSGSPNIAPADTGAPDEAAPPAKRKTAEKKKKRKDSDAPVSAATEHPQPPRRVPPQQTTGND